jgi:uncharacterized protein with PIN domain
MVTACFRVYAELNEFLPRRWRWQDFPMACARGATTKHMIEAIGIPHTEVDLILVDGRAVGFDHRLRPGERVSVYPRCTAFGNSCPSLLREAPPPSAFIADSHLGALARLLRMAGFDTLYRNDYADREIVAIAVAQSRIVLSRDRDLLKRRAVAHGCYVHATVPAQQFSEVVRRLDLEGAMQPFSRCLRCNAPLHEIARDAVRDRLPPSVRSAQTHFSQCRDCRRIYWPGTHWQSMRDRLDASLRTP